MCRRFCAFLEGRGGQKPALIKQIWLNSILTNYTVDPPNKGHVEISHFVHYGEAV